MNCSWAQAIENTWRCADCGMETDVILNCRKYVAAITRHAAGTATINGAGYPAAEK